VHMPMLLQMLEVKMDEYWKKKVNKMYHQFDNLSPDEINPNAYYLFTVSSKAKGFTLLMRYILEYRKYGDKILEKIKNLIVKDPDILFKYIKSSNCKSKWTVLAVASANSETLSSAKVVELLIKNCPKQKLESFINSSFFKKPFDSPLSAAVAHSNMTSNIRTVKLLLDNGADIHMPYGELYSDVFPLLDAVYNTSIFSNIEVVQFLLVTGANINQQNNQGISPLMDSTLKTMSTIETVKLLIDSNADLNLQNYAGRTALALVGENYNDERLFEAAEILIKKGANMDISDNEGKTVLDYVVSNNNEEDRKFNIDMVKLLLKNVCDIFNKDYLSMTKDKIIKKMLIDEINK